jgi:Zn-dependent protease with chaperone function
LKPRDRPAPATLFDKLSARMAPRASDKLFERVIADPPTARRVTAREVVTIAISLVVHAAALAMLVLGVLLLATTWPGPGVVLGAAAVAVAVMLRPRLGRLASNARSREELPELSALVDRVADCVGAPKVDRFILDGQMNASFGRYGLRRRAVLSIGMPLWGAAAPDERVALLGHELGHAANGDPSRSLIVGTAMRSLDQWYRLLTPQRELVRGGSAANSNVSGAEAALKPLLFVLRVIPWSTAFVLNQLRWTASQTAEYLADVLGARASGSDAAIRTFDLLYFASSFQFAVDQSRRNASARDPIDAFAERARNRTPREIERLRRIERMPGSAIDTTHPATWRRIALIEKLAVADAAVELDDVAWERIDAELAPHKEAAGRALREGTRAGRRRRRRRRPRLY